MPTEGKCRLGELTDWGMPTEGNVNWENRPTGEKPTGEKPTGEMPTGKMPTEKYGDWENAN